MDKSTLDSLRGMLRSEEIRAEMVEEMCEKWKRDIQENLESKERERKAQQAQIDSLPVQKETLAETKKNVQVSVHSARVALVSAVIAVVALVCQIVFFLLLR